MPRFTGPLKLGSTSRGAHVRALFDALAELAELMPRSARRDRIIAHRELLRKAYVWDLTATETDIAQILAEEDGDAVQDEGP